MNKEKDLQLAERIAQKLVREEVDDNEFAKIISYFRSVKNLKKTILMVKAFSDDFEHFSRSKRTKKYYTKILESALSEKFETKDPSEILYILSWSRKLMKYYLNKESQSGGRLPLRR